MGESMSEEKKSFSSLLSIFSSSANRPSISQGKILFEMFKMGEGNFLGIPPSVGSTQIADLKYAGLIDQDRTNKIYATKQGKRLIESMILGEDDCTYPLKEAKAAEKFKKGIPLNLLAKSSSIARM